ncbi:TadE/TadG family type IV pilus assembly protein [Streptomonospora nanhaiensis]|uniref:Flp pilus assembly protein TadG n=1 Tax=Streptomonospora nanhaiensis TaxID=1323731 RepID=A0A853BUZ0_9ACTN|nr:TadE/TadG family type IV pilus assembly protein [Streptomonospora nanhaiensis]MBV2365994.1 pilus assembly protein [Streptomonospora nanhaiensis]NYI98311.1 Flp pilus assembly protein TadG [Streptomonospora nanhaiensis]
MRRRRAEQGSAAVELMLAAPVLLLAALLMVAAGRYADAALEATAAAHSAARAASLHADPAHARTAARHQAKAALAHAGLSCDEHTVNFGILGSDRRQSVHAHVGCRIALGDLAPLSLPGHTVVEGEASAPVDPYRDTEAAP